MRKGIIWTERARPVVTRGEYFKGSNWAKKAARFGNKE
jgi:hypothetical protein